MRTASQLNALTQSLNGRFPDLPRNLQIGVGINKGEAAVGFGSENTIMGDVVNTAFRLESASKELGADIVANSSFYQMLPQTNLFDRKAQINVKGKHETLNVASFSFEELDGFLD